MLVAALTAGVANYAVLRGADESARVAVAARVLEPGVPVDATAFTVTEATVGDDVLAALVRADQLPELVGSIPSVQVPAGALLRVTDLRPASEPGEERAMSLPVDTAHAVGGDLRAGDRVDVIAVRDGHPAYVLVDAPVLAVADGARRGQTFGAGSGFSITVAVDERTALDLAAALDGDAVEVVRATGAPPLTLEPTGDD